jgi:DNA repair exonuclease SbcCD nuclease subunit
MDNVLILGDIHLGRSQSLGKVGIGSNINSRVSDQIDLLNWTLDKALEHNVYDIITTGDVFEDPKPHPSLMTIFIAWIKKCQAYLVNIHIIQGNHDMIRTGSVFTSSLDIISEADLEGVFVYKSVNTIILGSSAFTILPFRDRKSFGVSSNTDAVNLIRDSLIHELASIPLTYNKFLIGHLAIEGSIPVGDEIDDIANELFCPIDMFTGYDSVWMGHVHKPQVMNKKGPYVAHIGSMDISNFSEIDQKKHIVIIDCNSFSQNYISETLPTRSLKKISVIVPKDIEDTTGYVIGEIKKESNLSQSIVRLEVFMETPELKSVNKSQIESFLLKEGVFNIANISETKKISLIRKDNQSVIDTKMDVPSSIKAYANKYIDEDMRSDYIALSMEIYNSL